MSRWRREGVDPLHGADREPMMEMAVSTQAEDRLRIGRRRA